MSTRPSPTSRARRRAWACWLPLAGCLGALSAAGCGETTPQHIARFQDGTGGSAGVSEDTAGASAGPAAVPPLRGRVRVVNGKLVTDLGTPLRGALFAVDNANFMLSDPAQVVSIAQGSGLNTLHVYLENSAHVIGDQVNAGDLLITLAAQAGLYVVIGFGTGQEIGVVDAAQLKAFWTKYAARYGSYSNVLFEIQNNPEFTCDALVAEGTLSTERDTYKLIRSLAPDSHVLLFSTTSLIRPSVLTDAVKRLGTSVDWLNASFAMAVTGDCHPLSDFAQITAAAEALRVPLVINQLPLDGWEPYVPVFEAAQVSYFHFRWFAFNKDLASYRKAMTTAGVTWCPERGTFPEDASACH